MVYLNNSTPLNLCLTERKPMRREKYTEWTDAERKFVADNAHRYKDKELAEKLTELTGKYFSTGSVRTARNRFGIKKANGRGKCEVTFRQVNIADIFGAASAALHIKGGPATGQNQD